MTTNSTRRVTPPSSSIIDAILDTECSNGDDPDINVLESLETAGKRKYFNSPEITCSPSPCVFDWDRNKVREFTGKLNMKYFLGFPFKMVDFDCNG